MTTPTHYAIMNSPLGRILLAGNGRGLTHVDFYDDEELIAPQADWQEDPDHFTDAISQLDAYFHGEPIRFDLPLAPQGTPFQRRVWALLQGIPYGSTTTYGKLAELLGDPNTVRAVGGANARNPIAIIIPCHRVIGSNGQLTGYAGGLDRKRRLLELERSTQKRLLFSEWRAETHSDLL